MQTVIECRTIFQRRWRVSTVTTDTVGSISLVGGDATAVDTEATDAAELREMLNDRPHEALLTRHEARQQSRQAALSIRAAEPDCDADVLDSVAITDTEADVSQIPEPVEEAEPATARGNTDAEDTAGTGDTDDNTNTDDVAADDADELAETDDPFIWGESVESEGEDDEDAGDPGGSSGERDATQSQDET